MPSLESVKEEIRRAADIVELIGQYVQLRKAGRNYVGLCPFHAEKAPSFSVNPERRIFHCFGCKKGGDVFAFWMAYHGTTFPEAMRELAQRYGVEMQEVRFGPAQRRKAALREALLKVNEEAARFFENTLKDASKGEAGRQYLEKRGLSEEIISSFRLGYAPDAWEELLRHLTRRQVNVEVAVQAGLLVPRESGGHYDRFRNRVMFPIFNPTGKVVAFGGRVLGDGRPKYLNSPESPLFHKGELLYGLQAAFQAMREKRRAVLVEGYMDLLALRQNGLQEVAATLGTALTAEHVRRLKGYTDEAVVVFDSDRAGIQAALKALPLFLNENFSARVVVLPEGFDPDSYVNRHGLQAFMALVENAEPMFDFFIQRKLPADAADVEAKVRGLKEVLPVLAALKSQAHRGLYVRRLAERLQLREEAVWAELNSLKAGAGSAAREAVIKARLEASKVDKRFGSDIQFLNLLIHYPECGRRLQNCEWKALLSEQAVIEVAEAWFAACGRGEELSFEELMERIPNERSREELREAVFQTPFYDEQGALQAVEEFEERACHLRITEGIRQARETGNLALLNELLKEKAARAARRVGAGERNV